MNDDLQLLVCAIDDDIERVGDVLSEPREGIGYVVSLQYTDERFLRNVPDSLSEREDVTLSLLPGRGLSRNRNNALEHSRAGILLFADADNHYTAEGLEAVRESFRTYAWADIICFSACTYDGEPLKRYPDVALSYAEACRRGYYPSSVEMAVRQHVTTRFDERFGLGSERFCAGEEAVFLKDAADAGYRIWFVPVCIVSTAAGSTGSRFAQSPQLQQTKGATFCRLFGPWNALWRSLKEAGHYLIHGGANPLGILKNMIKGIWMSR